MQTLKKIVSAFGQLESFSHYTPSGSGSGFDDEKNDGNDQESTTRGIVDIAATDSVPAYPPPHDAPRSVGMDTGVWEVKWGQRDDCVSALMVSTASRSPVPCAELTS